MVELGSTRRGGYPGLCEVTSEIVVQSAKLLATKLGARLERGMVVILWVLVCGVYSVRLGFWVCCRGESTCLPTVSG